MITIDAMTLKQGRGNDSDKWYLFYGDAKQAGIRKGTTFQAAFKDGTILGTYVAREYINWRNDLNRSFSGFECVSVA